MRKILNIALTLTFLLTSTIWSADAKTHRSIYQRNLFLYQNGYCSQIEHCHVPHGYQVDHIQPLSEGGSDAPSNMRLLTIQEHKRITAEERLLYHW